mgnify:FL=1
MGLEIFKWIFVLSIGWLFAVCPAMAERKSLLVIADDNPSYTRAYQEIISGLLTNHDFLIQEIALTPESHSAINSLLMTNAADLILAIGNEANAVVRAIPTKAKIFSVKTSMLLGHEVGLSLSLDEAIIQQKLRVYLPHIKQIHIADNGESTLLFIDNQKTPKFIKQTLANDQASLVKYLWQTINTADPKTEAVWINNDIDHFFMYKLSERAWERNVTLISSNLTHLESGILMVFYPNFKRMGKRLGEMMSAKDNNSLSLVPINDFNQGINLKAALHLGINIPALTEHFSVIIK